MGKDAFKLSRALGLAVLFFGVCGAVNAANTVPYTVDKSTFAINEPLTTKPGDPVVGRKVAIDRKLGNCLACHTMPIEDQPFHGAIAPPLAGVGARYNEAQLRLRVVDPKVVNPATIMPAFHRVEGLHRVMKRFKDKPILTAQQVEDLVAYLATLK